MRPIALAQPGQSLADGIDSGADGLGARLHEIDIFGIAQRLFEKQLMNCSATSERDPVAQISCTEEIAQCSANNQILLHLPQVGPRSLCAPCLNVSAGNQASISTGSLIKSFHREFFSRSSSSDATSGLIAGFNGVTVFAFFANGSSARACRS